MQFTENSNVPLWLFFRTVIQNWKKYSPHTLKHQLYSWGWNVNQVTLLSTTHSTNFTGKTSINSGEHCFSSETSFEIVLDFVGFKEGSTFDLTQIECNNFRNGIFCDFWKYQKYLYWSNSHRTVNICNVSENPNQLVLPWLHTYKYFQMMPHSIGSR